MSFEFDFVVVGAGSAGCAVAAGLANGNTGTVCVLEAGPSDAVPNVKVPFGLLFTMGSGRDWNFKSSTQANAAARQLNVNRGRMVGGSSSINSMVWFRGRSDDFDAWALPGWSGAEVEPEFQEVEALIQPDRLPDPHPLSASFGRAFGSNGIAPPTPERKSAGVFHTNMRNGRRWSAADAFLRPALKTGRLEVMKNAEVDRLLFDGRRATAVRLIDGREVKARRGVILSAGSIGSPAILMRSGVGPARHLRDLGIDPVVDAPQVGENLHDHPSTGLHHAGPYSGYGLTADQLLPWAVSPLQWLLRRNGRMTSNFVEAGAFFRAAPVGPDGDTRPDVQTHFIPYMMGYQGKTITRGSGYFADVCLCRPTSRGRLTLKATDPRTGPNIDLGVLSDSRDLDILVAGLKKLRNALATTDFGPHSAPEVFPGASVHSDAELAVHIKTRCGTAYHPVGTLAMGANEAPVTPRLQLRGVDGVWIADASVMPSITSANTNAPSMMIGHKGAKLILSAL